MLCRGDCCGLQGNEVDHDMSGIGAKKGDTFTFITKKKVECLLEPLSTGRPTTHAIRSVMVYHECNIGLSG
jgi:hypothetical protein